MKPFVKPALFLLALCLLLGLFYFQQDAVKALLNHLSTLEIHVAAAIFICICILGSILMMPASVYMIAGGVYFGIFWGYLLNMAGFTAGAILSFLISRYVARDFVSHHLPSSLKTAMLRVHQHGWKLIAVLRLFGLVPAPAVNYGMGITPISLTEFTWSSFMFTLPIGFVFTYAGVAGQQFINSGEMKDLIFFIAALALAGIVIFTLRLRYVRNRDAA